MKAILCARRSAAAVAITVLVFALGACTEESSAPVKAAAGKAWSSYDRPEDYPKTVRLPDQMIAMRDGVRLSVAVTLPADAAGQSVQTPLPVILTQTGYNKSVTAVPASNEFLVRRGYVHVSVDVRGTGASEGEWEAFGQTEQEDYREVMDWVSGQVWSNGTVGTWGASFMAITQLFTAAHRHPAHKAVFAIVPMGDAYRDIVFTGGQVNVGFIPLWMGLVTGLGLIPSQNGGADAPLILAEHLISAVTNFQVPTIANAVLGNGANYDSEFWRTRSPLEVADRIDIPVFIVGGLNDIFQRGEPLLYEKLKDHTTAKLLIGPWQHLGGSSGVGLPRDGVPDLNHIALMWFDHYLRGMNTGAQQAPAVTQYYYGAERYVTAADWPHPQAGAQRWHLRGAKALTLATPAAGEAPNRTLQEPANGICSQSTGQWTAGVLGLTPAAALPCFSDNRYNELLEVAYTSAPMDRDYAFNGPIQADLWISTTALDAGVLVRVTDVAPDGRSRELTNGILTASLRKVDTARSRFLNGQMIQPWHPFTADSRQPLALNEIVQLPVEVFPTSAVIKQGHSLRITVGASDFPHGLPPVTDLADQAVGVLTIYGDAEHPSSVVIPAVPLAAMGL